MQQVIIVKEYDLGWDDIVAVFNAEQVSMKSVEKLFPAESYYVNLYTIETNLDNHV